MAKITDNFIITSQDAVKCTTEEDGALYIEGIANTGLRDMTGDKITQQALESIVEQALRHNLHMEHDKHLSGVLGPIIEAELTPEGIKFKSRIIDEKKDNIESLLKQGVNLGASISGKPTRQLINNKNIIGWNLTEISLTPYPADQATMGTVTISKSLNDVINDIEKELNEVDKMAEENYITEEKAVELINQAHAEKNEEIEKIISDKIGAEVEAKFAAIDERIKNIEDQLKADEKTEEETTTETTEETTTEEATEDTEKAIKELKDELQKDLKTSINDAMKEILNPNFKYEDKSLKDETNTEAQPQKSAYTPKELAAMMFKK